MVKAVGRYIVHMESRDIITELLNGEYIAECSHLTILVNVNYKFQSPQHDH